MGPSHVSSLATTMPWHRVKSFACQHHIIYFVGDNDAATCGSVSATGVCRFGPGRLDEEI